MNVLNDFINVILKFMISLSNLVLIPIDGAIESLLPPFHNGLSYVSAFFEWLSNLVPWAVSYLGLNNDILVLVVSYMTFRISITMFTHVIKLAIRWYNTLKIG